MGFQCTICGDYHEDFPMDVAYQLPADFFKVPKDEQEQRIKINKDLCVIDNEEFYVRGVLELPVKDSSENFCFGVWARISREDFKRYLELWNVPNINEAPFFGVLSGGIKYYENSDLLEVYIHLQSNNNRPNFEVASQTHELGIDQRQGITMNRVHQFVEPILKGKL